MYAVLARLISTSSKWANYCSWQFFKSFHCSNHVMNGNWLICWTPALSRYTTVQLMCWHVI